MEIKSLFIPDNERETAAKAYGYQSQVRVHNPDFDPRLPEAEDNSLSKLGDNPVTLEEFIHDYYQTHIINHIKMFCTEQAARNTDAANAARFSPENFKNKSK